MPHKKEHEDPDFSKAPFIDVGGEVRGAGGRLVNPLIKGTASLFQSFAPEVDENLPPLPPPPGGGGATLSFAQTAAGARLAASLARDVERTRGRERLKLEATLNSLAQELLPPQDVETAMRQVRRGELVKSKLAFQAVLENLADASRNEERRRDLALAEENERRTLKQARSRIVVDMIGKDLGRAVLFALGGSDGGA